MIHKNLRFGMKRLLAWLGLALMIGLASPAAAHTDHNKQEEAQNETPGPLAPGAMREMMAEHGTDAEARPPGFMDRLVSWLGRMHPFAVHFPIALIPASWLALVIARRRGHAVDVVRAVIILAGIAAVAAALLGWINAGFTLADRNPVLTYHRWVGTVLAVIVGLIGVWAWRQTESVASRAMTWVLGATTLLLLVQGWLGAAVTHGMDHMQF